MTLLRSSTRRSSGIFWSASKKKRASERRARITFSFPRFTTSGSRARVLLMAMKCGSSAPFSSVTGKYFWWEIIVVIRTSGGSFRNSGSKFPQTAVGYSVRKVTVSSSSSDERTRPPTAAAAFCDRSRIASALSRGSTMTKWLRVPARYSSRLPTGKDSGLMKR